MFNGLKMVLNEPTGWLKVSKIDRNGLNLVIIKN
jgi:hypothetical protein